MLSPKQIERLEKANAAARQLRNDRIRNYNLSPNYCDCCRGILVYDKRHNQFCSRSCAVEVNNKGKIRNYVNGEFGIKKCLHCDKNTSNSKFCGFQCVYAYKQDIRIQQFVETGIAFGNAKTVKICMISIRGHKCEVCGLEQWMGQLAPLVLDHINGKPDDWRLDNLQLVCGNCNMQLPTFAGRNVGKGGGRPYRNQRYIEGKSY
jgi:hypothetical protein